MAHFAKLDENNVVIHVNVVDNEHLLDANGVEQEALGVAYLTQWSDGYVNWKQTSYNGKFRKNYAGIGYTYDSVRDAFIPPKPFASWLFDENTCLWNAPVPYPTDVGTEENPRAFAWDEETQSWVEIIGV
jgi:hypothetical protein